MRGGLLVYRQITFAKVWTTKFCLWQGNALTNILDGEISSKPNLPQKVYDIVEYIKKKRVADQMDSFFTRIIRIQLSFLQSMLEPGLSGVSFRLL